MQRKINGGRLGYYALDLQSGVFSYFLAATGNLARVQNQGLEFSIGRVRSFFLRRTNRNCDAGTTSKKRNAADTENGEEAEMLEVNLKSGIKSTLKFFRRNLANLIERGSLNNICGRGGTGWQGSK